MRRFHTILTILGVVLAAGYSSPQARCDDPPPPADAGNNQVAPPPPPGIEPPPGTEPAAGQAPTPAPPEPSGPAWSSATPPEKSAIDAGSEDALDKALDAGKTGHFTGKPITLQVRDADIADILRLISEASGFNIVIGDDVRGKLTLSLVDVPWDQALDVVLHTMKLGAERNNNLLRVETLAGLTQEKQQELAAKSAALAAAPRTTKIFQISYADPNSLAALLSRIIAPGSSPTSGTTPGAATPTTGTAIGAGAPPGRSPSPTSAGSVVPVPVTTAIQVDNRTNSLIVQDIPENIGRIEKLIHLLDVATPQVLIEAKVIEANEQFQYNIQGQLGMGGAGSNVWYSSFMGQDPLGSLLGSAGTVTVPTNGGAFGFSPSLSFIPGLSRLNAVLQLDQSTTQIKIISAPKLVVLNKQQANILESTPVGMLTSNQSQGVISNGISISQANLSLQVTPTVTGDGSIELLLNLERDIPATISVSGITGQAVANRNLQTQVLVENGTTLVIGGVYDHQTQHVEDGFPFLKDIPIIGALFGKKSDNDVRTELFFFITPRILNAREAGLSG